MVVDSILRLWMVQESTALFLTMAEMLVEEEEESMARWPGREEGAGEGRRESGTCPPSQPPAWGEDMRRWDKDGGRRLRGGSDGVWTWLHWGSWERQRNQRRLDCILLLPGAQGLLLLLVDIFMLLLQFL